MSSWDQSWGCSLWSLHESLTDGLTIVVLICVAFFMMRRIFLARVRAITSFYDYVVLLIAAGPFLTGSWLIISGLIILSS